MEMDWESLLDELWNYAASDPKELEAKIRSCLKGHSSEGLLQAFSLLLSQGQQATARALLTEFLKNHQSADDIKRRLELIIHFKKNRAPQTLSIKSKQRSKELLIKDVNELVAAGKFQAAESLLLDAKEASEDPDVVHLLSRVYMLQHRPTDGAEAMQRALLLKRHQQAYVELRPEESADDLPTDGDLAFINGAAEHLSPLESPAVQGNKALPDTVDDSLDFIQISASQYPALKAEDWWEKQACPVTSEAPRFINEVKTGNTSDTTAAALDEDRRDEYLTESLRSQTTSAKPILTLAHSKEKRDVGEGFATVKVYSKSGRALPPVHPAGSHALEPVNSDGSGAEPAAIPTVEISTFKSRSNNEISDEVDEGEDEDEEREYFTLSSPSLKTPTSSQLDLGFDDLEDEIDFDLDLRDFTILEPEAGLEKSAVSDLDDFRDLDDEYAAYAFDPDEALGDEEASTADSDGWLSDIVSREDRALQKAAELIGKANWPASALPLIQQIFVLSGWGATRLALEREIEKGLTPDELILAAHIKVIWAENDIYWISFDRTGSSRLSQYVLSWPSALLIVRSFESLPQVEEIEVFLENLFMSWYENKTLRRAFKAFARYLWFRFANLEGCLPASQHFDFCNPHELPAEEYSDLGLCDPLEHQKTEILRGYGVFQTKHPQEPGCYFSDKPVIERPPPVNAENRSQDASNDANGNTKTEAVAISEEPEDARPQWSALPLSQTGKI